MSSPIISNKIQESHVTKFPFLFQVFENQSWRFVCSSDKEEMAALEKPRGKCDKDSDVKISVEEEEEDEGTRKTKNVLFWSIKSLAQKMSKK